MAEKRMFSRTILDSDSFLDMPASSQMLYIHLAMRADDDGFVSAPKRVARYVGSSDDDLRLLVTKGFLIPFDSGVAVITHWRIHNYLRADRYKETVFRDEMAQLTVRENGAYLLGIHSGIPDGIPTDNQPVYQLDTQYRVGKVRIVKDSRDTVKEIDRGIQGGKKEPLSTEVEQVISELTAKRAAYEAEKRRHA